MKKHALITKQNYFDRLPDEAILYIFSFLKGNINSNLAMRRVCKRTNGIINSLLKMTDSCYFLTNHINKFQQKLTQILAQIKDKTTISSLIFKITHQNNDILDENSPVNNLIKTLQEIISKKKSDLQKLIKDISIIHEQENKKLIKNSALVSCLSCHKELFEKIHNDIWKQINNGVLNIFIHSDVDLKHIDKDTNFLTDIYLKLSEIDYDNYYSKSTHFLRAFVHLATTDELIATKLKEFVKFHYKKAISYIPKLLNEINSGRIQDCDLNHVFNPCRYGARIVANQEEELLTQYKEVGAIHFRQLSELSSFSRQLKNMNITESFSEFNKQFEIERVKNVVSGLSL